MVTAYLNKAERAEKIRSLYQKAQEGGLKLNASMKNYIKRFDKPSRPAVPEGEGGSSEEKAQPS